MWDLLFNSRKILSRNRYPWIDYARGICIILVCYRHIFGGVMTEHYSPTDHPVLSYINIFFFSFRMPLFFIVSGMFYKLSQENKGTSNFVRNRAQTILYPLLLWGTIHITLQLLFADYVNVVRQPADYLKLLYEPRSIEQFWYLNALFFVGVSYALISKYASFNTGKQLVLGIVLYGVAGYLHMQGIDAGFITDVFFFYFFFAIGDAVSGFMLDKKQFKNIASWKTLLLILPVFILLQHYFTKLNFDSSDDYYVQNTQPVLFAVAALVGGSFIICCSFLLQKSGKLKFLRVVGYHSMYIYVTNLIITSGTRTLMIRVFGIDNMYLVLLVGTIAGIVLPIMFYNIMTRAGAWWLFTLQKPRAIAMREEKKTIFRGLTEPEHKHVQEAIEQEKLKQPSWMSQVKTGRPYLKK
ncbi:MAG: acyltransferase [Chitinophagaceae bacterium]|nr:acyltransferase [Chitinophagaceae bacterium]